MPSLILIQLVQQCKHMAAPQSILRYVGT